VTATGQRQDFFFEKKKQKTFDSRRGFHDAGQVPDLAVGAGGKSLLVLFFRKEHAVAGLAVRACSTNIASFAVSNKPRAFVFDAALTDDAFYLLNTPKAGG
jgi:hypothetical protein